MKVEKRKRHAHDQGWVLLYVGFCLLSASFPNNVGRCEVSFAAVLSAAAHEEGDRLGYAQEMNGEAEGGGSDESSPPRSNSKRAKGKIRNRVGQQRQVDEDEPVYQNLILDSPSEVQYCPIKGNDIEFAILPGRCGQLLTHSICIHACFFSVIPRLVENLHVCKYRS